MSADPRGLPLCETTMTPRLSRSLCKECGTYPDNLGPCETWAEGGNGRCVYCDHGQQCHLSPDELRLEMLVVDIAREMYDRFVMGGWTPEDAHPQIRAMLRAHLKEAD